MTQGLFARHMNKFVPRERAEGAAGCREVYPFNRVVRFTVEALKDGRVFRVDGQERRSLFPRQRQNQFARHNQRLLVGQRDGFACLQCGDNGFEAGKAYHSRERHIYRLGLYSLRNGVGSCPYFHRKIAQRLFDDGVFPFIRNDDDFGTEAARLLDQSLRLPVSGEEVDVEQVGMRSNDFQRLRADGAGRAEDGQLSLMPFVSSVHSQKAMYSSGFTGAPLYHSSKCR